MVRSFMLMLALLAASPALAELPVPPLTGPVVDRANLLDSQSVAELSRMSREAHQGGQGPQLQYLIVPSLEGEPIESFSMRVAEKWKLGTKGRDNGVLVVVAVKDRAVRIEVGGGIEGALTDAQAGRIIRNAIAPAFRQQDYGGGLQSAGKEILTALGRAGDGESQARMEKIDRGGFGFESIHALLLIGLALAIVIVRFLFQIFSLGGSSASDWRDSYTRSTRRERSWSSGGGGSWSGGSSGGNSGGSWSGGGGSFSGGGASGSW